MTQHDVHGSTLQTRTGPVSRFSRVLMAGATGWFAVEWATYGIGRFSQTKTLANPWFWFIVGTGIYYGLYQTAATGFGRRWGTRVVVAFAVLAIGAGAAAVAAEGELWAAPLTWLLFGLVVGQLILTAIGALGFSGSRHPRLRVRRARRAHPAAPRRARTRGCRFDVVRPRDASTRCVGGGPVDEGRWSRVEDPD